MMVDCSITVIHLVILLWYYFFEKHRKYKAFQAIGENKNAAFNMIYHEKQIWNYRDGIVYKSQEMPDLRRFLARFWLSDNQMTIILEIILSVS